MTSVRERPITLPRERPITLPREAIERIKAGEQTIVLTPIEPQPQRLDDAFDGTWGWPNGDYPRYDDLTMASAIREDGKWRDGDLLRVFQARGKSHLTIINLILRLTDARPQLLPWLTEEDARASGYQGGHDSIPGYQFSATPLEHLRYAWQDQHPNIPWGDAWVWRLELHPLNPS